MHKRIVRSYLTLSAFLFMVVLSGCAPEEKDQSAELAMPQVEFIQYTATASGTPTLEPTITPTWNLLITLTPTITPTFTLTPTITLSPTVTVPPTPTLSPTSTLTPTPTTDPYQYMYINTLIERKYGGGVIQDVGNLNSVGSFTRKLFKYRSEGLNLYGFINIPPGQGPFPVVVMLHGYVSPDEYATLDYSTRYADALAEAGFIVIHPNLRGYAPSAKADNFLGIGDTIDVLNLIHLLRSQAGSAGLLQKADANRIGLWGHSMGGGIVQRVLIVDEDIKAALLYASVNVDEALNLAHFDDDGRGNEKEKLPEEALALISPENYLERIDTPISIHHGEADIVVPPEWSQDLCVHLQDLNIDTECVTYPGQPHTFQNSGDTRFIRNMIGFFTEYLNPGE